MYAGGLFKLPPGRFRLFVSMQKVDVNRRFIFLRHEIFTIRIQMFTLETSEMLPLSLDDSSR